MVLHSWGNHNVIMLILVHVFRQPVLDLIYSKITEAFVVDVDVNVYIRFFEFSIMALSTS